MQTVRLAAAPSRTAVVGLPDELPKHWAALARPVAAAARSAAELRAFLRREVAAATAVDGGAVAEDVGLAELGVDSLATLRLSQRLRRFLGRDFSTFALLDSPSIGQLVTTLTDEEEPPPARRGRVLCLHGFKTSGAVLAQQLAPVAATLVKLSLIHI